jgi:hypothetical protein
MITLWVSTNPRIEPNVYDAWLRGDEGVQALRPTPLLTSLHLARVVAQALTGEVSQYGLAIVFDSIRDQYGTVEALEPFLQQPRLIETQDIVPLDRKVVDELLTKLVGVVGSFGRVQSPETARPDTTATTASCCGRLLASS